MGIFNNNSNNFHIQSANRPTPGSICKSDLPLEHSTLYALRNIRNKYNWISLYHLQINRPIRMYCVDLPEKYTHILTSSYNSKVHQLFIKHILSLQDATLYSLCGTLTGSNSKVHGVRIIENKSQSSNHS